MRRASAPLLLRRRASTSSPQPNPCAALTDRELAEITTLVPRLCDAGRHHDAVRLLSVSLLASPPISALPLATLSAGLAAHPDLAPAMDLLTALRHNPRRPSPLPFCNHLISAYLSTRRLKEAAKVFAWLCRADSPSRPDAEVYRITVTGFCLHGRALEAVRVLREMARDGVALGTEMREAVRGSLLREAMVDEALELDDALGRCAEEDGDGIRGAAEVLDRLIREWEE